VGIGIIGVVANGIYSAAVGSVLVTLVALFLAASVSTGF
jgi:hypothetical protein